MGSRHGYGVLLFDQTGDGESVGDRNAFGWDGEKDVMAAVAYLKRQPDVDPGRFGGIGLSVGGELLLQAAAHTPDLRLWSPREPVPAPSARSWSGTEPKRGW